MEVSVLAVWHLVLVLKTREGEGCECSQLWLRVVGVDVCEMELGIEMNVIHHHCLVAMSPLAMSHLILMLKNGAGGDMSAHACGCRSLMWALVEKDIIQERLLVATSLMVMWHLVLVLKTGGGGDEGAHACG
jgi:hypothetical protein